MSVILYQDSQVTIYPELLVIKKYYFPLATSKTILISDIERVGLYSSEGVAHRWGVCGKYLNNWFPYDGNRKNKTKFIEIILKGGKTRPSITPDDPDAAFKIIWENFTKEGRDYVEHQSQLHDGKETELAREEMMKEGDTSEQVIQNVKKSPKEMIKIEAVDE